VSKEGEAAVPHAAASDKVDFLDFMSPVHQGLDFKTISKE
jgi:hypothetical protein